MAANLAGVNNLQTKAVRAKKHVPRANTPPIAATHNAKEIKTINVPWGRSKVAIASPLARKGKTG